MCGAVERVDARRVGDLGGDVVGPPVEERRRAGGERSFGIGGGGQRLVVDGHELGGVDGLDQGLGHDNGHRFAHEAHLAVRKRGAGELVGHLDEPVVRGHAELCCGDDLDHARRPACLAGVDAADMRVGDRGAHEYRVAYAVGVMVIDVATARGEQLGVLAASYFVAQDRSGHGRRGYLRAVTPVRTSAVVALPP